MFGLIADGLVTLTILYYAPWQVGVPVAILAFISREVAYKSGQMVGALAARKLFQETVAEWKKKGSIE